VDDTEPALRTQVAANCCTQHQGSVALCGRVQCILPMVGSLFQENCSLKHCGPGLVGPPVPLSSWGMPVLDRESGRVCGSIPVAKLRIGSRNASLAATSRFKVKSQLVLVHKHSSSLFICLPVSIVQSPATRKNAKQAKCKLWKSCSSADASDICVELIPPF
jgi:hypothetical protein